MPGDGPPRLRHSFLSFFCFANCLPSRPSPRNNYNGPSSDPYIGPSRYELYRPSPRFPKEPMSTQTNNPAPVHPAPREPSVSASDLTPFAAPEHLAQSFASPSLPHSASPSASPSTSRQRPEAASTAAVDTLATGCSYRASFTNDATDVSQTSPLVNQCLPATPPNTPYHEKHGPIHQIIQHNNSVQSNSADRLYSAHPYGPALQRPQVEQIVLPGTQLSHPPLASLHPPRSPNTHLSHPQHNGYGMFYQASNVSLTGNVLVDNHAHNFTLNISDNDFMTVLLKNTIPGAEFDSSDRNPPPRCHPGTRLEIIRRCQAFILNSDGRTKLRWVVGAAGVGKSAIMQSVAEDKYDVLSHVIVGATIFFSINGRQDGTKAITTIVYQLAVKLEPYRLFVQGEVTRDPSLFQKSLPTQFNTFIVEPFIRRHILDSSRLLIIIDGLDECANPSTQKELLNLISDCCIKYPTSPLVWIIASRPEPHITSFFSQPKVAQAYEKEEILVDSNQAREDVERYLRDELKEVHMASIALRDLTQWPSEDDFLKIAKAADGLFAYASTVVRYINDPTYGDPVSLLDDVLGVIDSGTTHNLLGQDHPMAQLDALYAHIMSKIPAKVMVNTRKLLLLILEYNDWTNDSFRSHCNMLGMTQHVAYGATHDIHSVVSVPGPAEAAKDGLHFFHKSFQDYLIDFERSGFSPDFESEARQLKSQCVLRILEEAPDGISWHDDEDELALENGLLKNGPGTGDNISLTWPGVEEDDSHAIRLDMYRSSFMEVMIRFDPQFLSLFCIRAMTTSFAELPGRYPWDLLRDYVFDESRRSELLQHGVLQQVPLETLEFERIPLDLGIIRLQFRSLAVDHWNTSCEHHREGEWGGHEHYWSAEFSSLDAKDFGYSCGHCFERFAHHFKAQPPGHIVTVVDLTPYECGVELQFIDPDDGVSVWIYYFRIGRDAEDNDDDYTEEDGDDRTENLSKH